MERRLHAEAVRLLALVVRELPLGAVRPVEPLALYLPAARLLGQLPLPPDCAPGRRAAERRRRRFGGRARRSSAEPGARVVPGGGSEGRGEPTAGPSDEPMREDGTEGDAGDGAGEGAGTPPEGGLLQAGLGASEGAPNSPRQDPELASSAEALAAGALAVEVPRPLVEPLVTCRQRALVHLSGPGPVCGGRVRAPAIAVLRLLRQMAVSGPAVLAGRVAVDRTVALMYLELRAETHRLPVYSMFRGEGEEAEARAMQLPSDAELCLKMRAAYERRRAEGARRAGGEGWSMKRLRSELAEKLEQLHPEEAPLTLAETTLYLLLKNEASLQKRPKVKHALLHWVDGVLARA